MVDLDFDPYVRVAFSDGAFLRDPDGYVVAERATGRLLGLTMQPIVIDDWRVIDYESTESDHRRLAMACRVTNLALQGNVRVAGSMIMRRESGSTIDDFVRMRLYRKIAAQMVEKIFDQVMSDDEIRKQAAVEMHASRMRMSILPGGRSRA